jgi:hypothetical protein
VFALFKARGIPIGRINELQLSSWPASEDALLPLGDRRHAAPALASSGSGGGSGRQCDFVVTSDTDSIALNFVLGNLTRTTRASLMGAELSADEESRIILDHGPERMVMMAYETFSRASSSFETAVRTKMSLTSKKIEAWHLRSRLRSQRIRRHRSQLDIQSRSWVTTGPDLSESCAPFRFLESFSKPRRRIGIFD